MIPSPRPVMHLSRRSFCFFAAASGAVICAPAQIDRATARPDVAAIDRDRILAAAEDLLRAPLVTLPEIPIPSALSSAKIGSNDLFIPDEETSADVPERSRADVFLRFTGAVPALAAACYLKQGDDAKRAAEYASRASAWLDAWLTTPPTRMTPSLAVARLAPDSHAPLPEGVAEAAALGEVAKAIPFVVSAGVSTEAQQAAWLSWFRDLAGWLDTARLAGLARDSKDHIGSAWLLLRVSCAALLGDEASLTSLRHRFRTPTLRAQIRADGTFPHDLTTSNPYSNCLFNLDLLAASADLLSTRFESAWEYELQDGPGMRAAIARHAPWIADRKTWPYPADVRHFTQLPARRPALLLAARALQQAQYASVWRTLSPAEPTIPALLRTFPLRQPLLWTVRPRPQRPS